MEVRNVYCFFKNMFTKSNYSSMKKILFLLIILFSAISCTTNHYTVLLTEETALYKDADNNTIITTIPKNTQVYLSYKPSKKNY